MKWLLICILFSLTNIYAQSISVTPMYTFGNYSVNDTSAGSNAGTLGLEVYVDIPINDNLSIGPYLFLYKGVYTDNSIQPYIYKEKSTSIGLTFTYSFSDK